jgi:hypothetical protein
MAIWYNKKLWASCHHTLLWLQTKEVVKEEWEDE